MKIVWIVLLLVILARTTDESTGSDTATVGANCRISTELRQGDSSADVRCLEQRLDGLNYDVGTVDRSFDERTDAAVRKYQTDNSLIIDGVVGSETGTHLEIWTTSVPDGTTPATDSQPIAPSTTIAPVVISIVTTPLVTVGPVTGITLPPITQP